MEEHSYFLCTYIFTRNICIKYLYKKVFTIRWCCKDWWKYFVKMQLHKKTPSRIRTILIHWVTLGNLIWSHIGGRSFTVFAISCFLFFKQIFKNSQNIMWSFRKRNYKQFKRALVQLWKGEGGIIILISLST